MIRSLMAAGLVAAIPSVALADAPPLRRSYKGPAVTPEAPQDEPEVVAPRIAPPPPAEPPPPSAAPPPRAAPPPSAAPPGASPSPPSQAPVAPQPQPAPAGPDDAGFDFEVVDLSDDEEALKKELQVKTKAVKGRSGRIAGRVLDQTSGDPVIGAYVEAIGTAYRTKTGPDGRFSLELPVGAAEIRIRSDVHQPRRVSNVVVAEGKTQTLNTEVQPLEGAGQVVVVETEMNRESEGARLLQRKESAGARDLMSRDEIAKAGGGATSAVARRIVGVTLVGGRYIFVRGLGHRYGNTLFDGARVPSPEPELRTVPLDIFPSSALSAINVQKTFTPDVPGDFAGGSVQLESREVPDDFMYEVGANVGANTATTFRQMHTSGSFPLADAFAFGNLPRALPSELPGDRRASRGELDADFNPIYTREQIEAFGDSMYTDTRVRRSAKAPPNFGVKAAIGYGFRPQEDSKFGFLVAANYNSKHQSTRIERPIRQFGVSDGQIAVDSPQVEYTGRETTYTVSWSTIGLVKYDLDKNNRLSLAGFYSREAEDETRFFEGRALNVSGPDPVINTRLRYIMRSVLLTRLGGRHTFPQAKDLTLDWFGSYAQARRDDPAIRSMFFTNATGEFLLDRGNEGAKQAFLDLVDHTQSGALNLTLPFLQWSKLRSKVKAGAWLEGKQRDFVVRRFSFQVDPMLTDAIPRGTGNIINDAATGGGDGSAPFFLQETTRPSDNYRAHQEIYAGYAMLELPLVRWFRVVGGPRLEASRLFVETYDPFLAGDDETMTDEPVRRNNLDVLPSVGLIFSPTDKQNIRLVGTRTLARPEFRELAPFTFTDFVGGVDVQGNTELQQTKIWNADLRWEWFPSSAEVIALSAFYKFFDEPIERVKLPRIPQLASFRNADAAHNIGGELEVRKNLEFIWKKFRDLSLGANFAYIYSRVRLRDPCQPSMDTDCADDTLADVSTSRVRPLQDQSPFVVNAYLSYDNEEIGTGVRLLYNVAGRRIFEVGGLGLPDIYREPQHNLDLVFTQRLYKGLQMDLTAKNLLNSPVWWSQQGVFVEWWQQGLTFTLGLSWRHERTRDDEEL